MKHNLIKLLCIFLLAVTVNACKEDNPPLPDNLIGFEADALGMDESQSEAEVNVTLSRAETTPVEITVQLEPARLTYEQDFTTTPAAANGQLKLTIPAGQTSGSIKITKVPGTVLNGDESIQLNITAVSTPVLVSSKSELALSFAAITSTGSALVLNGKTDESNYFNTVYVDLSGNHMVAVPRKSWNLGFYSGESFRVVLNPAYQTVVTATSKSDIAEVGIADAEGIELNFAPGEGTLDMVDNWNGDLTQTAIAEVSATDADNKVYLLGFEGNKSTDLIYKIKVSRSSTGYKLQYARLGETAIKTLEIPKDEDYNFVFASVESEKIVPVEPRAKSWDIEWAYSTYNSGLDTPYWFQDFILLNTTGGAAAAEIIETTALTYSTFAESDIASLTFSQARDVIGSKWRNGGGISSPASIRSDRFYVIQDPSGNIYKLRFTSLGANGERGKPELEYLLVKKAN